RAAAGLRAGEGRRDRRARRHGALAAGTPRRGDGMVRKGPRHRSRQPGAASGAGGHRHMRPGRLFLTLACVGLLAGCATRPPAPVVLPALDTAALARAEALQDERARALAAGVDWDFTGRASITRGDKGGSGRIEWRQRGEAFEVALAAPVTRQGWRLAVDGDGARID